MTYFNEGKKKINFVVLSFRILIAEKITTKGTKILLHLWRIYGRFRPC